MKAYITTHNAFKIVNRDNTRPLEIKGTMYKKPIYLFSKYEVASLLAVQELMKNPEQYFKDVYNPLSVSDSKKYVFKEKNPSYHLAPDCPNLNSEYKNFEIPNEIIAKGEEMVDRFRKWFLEHQHQLEKPDLFVANLAIAFGITYNPRAIVFENSGFTEFKNQSVEEMEKIIDNLLVEAGRYYYESKKNTTILSTFGKHTSLAFKTEPIENNKTGYSDDEIRSFLKDYYERFKKPLKHYLVEYYRVKLNPNLEFAKSVLEAIGFKQCPKCSGEKPKTRAEILVELE